MLSDPKCYLSLSGEEMLQEVSCEVASLKTDLLENLLQSRRP